MKQVIRRGLKEIIVDEIPEPLAGSGQIAVRPVYSLISSGTETASIHREGVLRALADNPSHIQKVWNVAKGAGPVKTFAEVRAKFSEYAALGYAGAGVVHDLHPSVGDVAPGDRVAYGGEGTGHGEVIVTGRNLIARVPDEVSFEQACYTTVGSIALHAVRTATIGLGETVVVIGLGLVGQLVSQLARLQGARVIAIDPRSDRVDLARRLGAEHGLAVDSSAGDGVRTLTDGVGADCVIVAAAAKSDEPSRLALRLCRDRGRIVVVGAVEVSFPWHEMYLKEIEFRMSRAYGPGSYDPEYEREGRDYPLPYVRWTEHRNMEEFLRLVSLGHVRVDDLTTHRFALDDAPAAYDTIMTPGSGSLAVLLRYPDADTPASLPLNGSRRAPSGRQVTRIAGAARSSGALRVALVGAGNIARWAHLPALRKASGAALHAVYSANGVRAKSYAQRFGAEYCATSYDAILEDQSIDVVLIASRNQSHAQQALAALRAGKHVFVEKPMAITELECRLLREAVEETGRSLTVGFNRRFAPDFLAVKKELAKRRGPAVLNCRVNSPGIAGGYWMADPAIGGAILGEACHFIDLFYWLVESEPAEVSAYSLPTGNAEPVGENNVAATFRFEDGSIATLSYSTVGSATSGGEQVEAFAPGIGVATSDFKRLSIRGRIARTSSRLFPAKGYDAQLASFFDAVREGGPPQVTVRDGARATIGCLRMLDSAREGRAKLIDLRAAVE